MGETVTIQKIGKKLIRPQQASVAPGTDAARLRRGSQNRSNALWPDARARLAPLLLSIAARRAVQSVHIDGVLHEFSSIAGVRRGRHRHRAQHTGHLDQDARARAPSAMVVKKQGPALSPPAIITTVGAIRGAQPDLRLHARRGAKSAWNSRSVSKGYVRRRA